MAMKMMMMIMLVRTAPTTPAMIKRLLVSTGVCVVVGVLENRTDGGSPVVRGCIVNYSADALMYITLPEPDVSGIVVSIMKSVVVPSVNGRSRLPVWKK